MQSQRRRSDVAGIMMADGPVATDGSPYLQGRYKPKNLLPYYQRLGVMTTRAPSIAVVKVS